MSSIRTNIFRKAASLHTESHTALTDQALERLETAESLADQRQAEALAIRNYNLVRKLGGSYAKLSDSAAEKLVALCSAKSAADLVSAMEPTHGRFGGWNQHTGEFLPALASRLAGEYIPNASVDKLFPLVMRVLQGETVTRAEFTRAALTKTLNNIHGQFLSFLTMPAKGPAVLDPIMQGRSIVAYKATQKGIKLGQSLTLA
jgi:hypothetical protein